MKKFGINIGVVILFLVVVFSCVEQKSENVKIGVILPLTGTYANLGKDVKNGIELAKWTYQFSRKEVNEDIELIYLDDKSSSVGGVSAIQNLIFKENPVAIIGGISSTTTMAIAPIAEKNKIVLISPTASSPQISDIGEYIFRVCASDLQEGIKMAQYLASENVDRIGIVYVENDYGQGLYNAFMSALSENLIKVKFLESYLEGTTDFRNIIAKLKKHNIANVYIPGYAQGVGQFLKQSKEMGFKPNFFSSISFEDPKVVEIAGDAANGVIYTAYNYDASIDSGIVGRFNLNYEKKYNKRPNIYSALGYDAAYVLFYVLDKAYPETDKLNSELSSVKIEKTITSKISFDENGDVKQGITLKKYLNGKYYFLTKNL